MNYEQWLRHFRLVVSINGQRQEALDLSEYRTTFHISQAAIGKPCTAEITVYNVAKSTADMIEAPTNAVIGGRRPRVILEAGYQDDYSTIFEGDLYWKSLGRDSETETFMRLVAATGDRAQQYAVVNASIPKGATQEQVFDVVAKSMAEKGVCGGKKPTLMATKLPRGKVLYMMSADAMQGLADTNQFDWGYTSNGLVAISKDRTYRKSEDVIVLNSETGMVGRPTLSVEGIDLQCLLQPRIDVGSLIQIDNASIQRQSYDTGYQTDLMKNAASTDAFVSADGVYRVVGREHVGDTRGNDWYTKILAVGVNASQQPLTPTAMTNLPNL